MNAFDPLLAMYVERVAEMSIFCCGWIIIFHLFFFIFLSLFTLQMWY